MLGSLMEPGPARATGIPGQRTQGHGADTPSPLHLWGEGTSTSGPLEQSLRSRRMDQRTFTPFPHLSFSKAAAWILSLSLFFFFFFFGLFAFSGAASTEYGGSQARGATGAVATGLHQGHSNVGSEPRQRPTPQLTAMPDP